LPTWKISVDDERLARGAAAGDDDGDDGRVTALSVDGT
jgi:hypothetical protein